MMRNITVGIDIGTYQVKVVVSELVKADGTGTESGQAKTVRVIGTGLSESKGLRHGYIINGAEVTQSIKIAISLAEKTSGVKIHKAFIAVGGIGLQGLTSIASTIISRADSEITDLDITKISEECEEGIATNLIQNRRVLHSIPLSYKIDGKLVLAKSPLGMKGSKLEIKMLFVTCLESHLNDLLQAVEESGIEVIDVLASPIAASFVTLSKQQKIAGSVLVNIGAETISMVVFENNIPISLEVFAIGSTDITHDIALGLKIPLEEAENVKLGALGSNSFSKKKLDEIIEARLSDMFELILNHLKKIGRSELLPAGIFLSGGGGAIPTVENFAKMALNLPSRIVELNMGEKKNHIKDSTWAVAYGLCVLGFSKEEKVNLGLRNTMNKSSQIILGWIKKFLP
ncbi:MAG: cell division protein FtsA [Candidatus Zambryskibacteria bacterium RIFCSPLOWO2_12_FULL_39_45]|uniref:Cell division protein FtsA n=3 Tax=Candidatus Zambryskiibacteriota TaxID=1817925 RepID=A0A1G2T912_9BACT|nr:MAG: cell division protein FtsA [Candidatus Zambryskibacteria bacterium RIFCSPHIGHO2_02_38_10.5]OHA97767.1 MAG: cell division protein FtsA [Candidatus Zambryskibacteria bacterium RIFCSPHIGHO2_12_FULL_38_37]OHB09073.1 MAG: cell division protein FtsA [Candidatus Zambryskibacteria bacterium RIFCSPLOWO2_02_39_10]OHB09827.1 MAG: cell division protein FtsA [Candidatus Zambryskibacteria bacterium RIFCSPLOWO2_02_FULL_39_69]OHB13262.1 MAG: cell division protein FtsA [Candidatus Zambryskibacteria bact